MGTRLGLLVGVAIGYILGARAGRERYEQIVSWFGELTGRGHEAQGISQSWPGLERPTS